MARFGSEKIRGHGIPEALEAILLGRSRMEPKVAVLKPLSAAISIGTGGPFGAEGPIIMTGGALGSIFAQQFHLSSAERKTLLVAGAAAGMSAVFGSPVAALLLAVELLLFEWKPRSFIPVAVAAIVASILRVPLLGGGPIFPVTPHAVPSGFELLAAVGLGVLAGFASGALTGIVYFCEDLFQKLPIHWMWWPAIGAVFIGIGGWYDPRVLGVGYDTIHGMLRGELIGAALAGLLITKAIIWSIALGSGTSGGVLAPLLIMGGALGALVGHYIPQGDPGMWALIGMAAMMGGTMRSPLTAMVFAVEVTHDYNLFPALFIGSVAALGVTVLLMKRSILTEKLARRGHHITREYSIDPFELVRVRDVMDDLVPMVSAKLTLAEFATRLNEDPDLSRRQGTVVVDERGKLAGMITRGDLFRAMREGDPTRRTVVEVCSTNVVVAYPDDSLHAAVTKMLDRGVGRLPVVEPENPTNVLGYLGRAEVLTARSRLLEEEHVREARGPVWGWGAGRRLKQS
jgi:H+/Cl- antiporter ClcA/CBS domain-containing protein